MAAHAGQLPVLGPPAPVGARVPVEFPHARVLGKQMQEALAVDPPGLRVGHLFLRDQLEAFDRERLNATVLEPRPDAGSSADEDPDVAVLVQGDAGIVVGIVDTFLVMHDHRTRHYAEAVVVVRDHRQQMSLPLFCAAVDEKRLLRFRRVDGQRQVLGGVGRQTHPGFLSPYLDTWPSVNQMLR